MELPEEHAGGLKRVDRIPGLAVKLCEFSV